MRGCATDADADPLASPSWGTRVPQPGPTGHKGWGHRAVTSFWGKAAQVTGASASFCDSGGNEPADPEPASQPEVGRGTGAGHLPAPKAKSAMRAVTSFWGKASQVTWASASFCDSGGNEPADPEPASQPEVGNGTGVRHLPAPKAKSATRSRTLVGFLDKAAQVTEGGSSFSHFGVNELPDLEREFRACQPEVGSGTAARAPRAAKPKAAARTKTLVCFLDKAALVTEGGSSFSHFGVNELPDPEEDALPGQPEVTQRVRDTSPEQHEAFDDIVGGEDPAVRARKRSSGGHRGRSMASTKSFVLVKSLPSIGSGAFLRRGVQRIVTAAENDRSLQAWLLEAIVPALLLMTHVLVGAGDNTIKSASKTVEEPGDKPSYPYEVGAVLFLASITSVFLGNALTACHTGWAGLRNVWSCRKLASMCLPSIMFQTAQILKFAALKLLPMDLFTLLDQSQLVVLAVMSRPILGRHYSPPEWCMLVVTSVAMLQYMLIRDQENNNKEPGESTWAQGLVVTIAQVLVSVVAALLAEKFLKGRTDPFWEQKAQLEFWGALTAFAYLLFNPEVHWNGFLFSRFWTVWSSMFEGWSWMTVLVYGIILSKLWLSTFIAKMLDSVVKQLGSCVAMMLIYVLSIILPRPWTDSDDNKFELKSCVSIVVVALSIASFAMSSKQAKLKQIEASMLREIVELTERPRPGNVKS